jgi:23S rRNA (guanosine2251-2'-O)-methyltransferase
MTTDDNKRGSPKDSHYARLRRKHRDANQPATGDGRSRGRAPAGASETDSILLYGLHSVKAAIGNADRTIIRLMASRNALQRLDVDMPEDPGFSVEIVEPSQLDGMLPPDAVHQGIVAEALPLPSRTIEDIRDSHLVIVLDQITDPHNVGAIMRSATAFSAGAIITTTRHSPPEGGVLAKAASGALEAIAYIRVTNLADAIATLQASGYTTIGLDSEGPNTLEDCFTGEKIALVLGAEGKGLRQKTRDCVQSLARLDVPGTIKSLNVSNAAAIALYATKSFLANTRGRPAS